MPAFLAENMHYFSGSLIGASSQLLPDAEQCNEQFCEIHLTITMRFERKASRHGKSWTYFWLIDGGNIEGANLIKR